MADQTELRTLIDSFLGKGGKDSYIVKKISAIFDGATAPFDLKKGPLKDFRKNIKDLNTKIEDLSKNTEEFSKNVKKFNGVFTNDFLKSLRGFRDNLNIPILKNFFKTLEVVSNSLNNIRHGPIISAVSPQRPNQTQPPIISAVSPQRPNQTQPPIISAVSPQRPNQTQPPIISAVSPQRPNQTPQRPSNISNMNLFSISKNAETIITRIVAKTMSKAAVLPVAGKKMQITAVKLFSISKFAELTLQSTMIKAFTIASEKEKAVGGAGKPQIMSVRLVGVSANIKGLIASIRPNHDKIDKGGSVVGKIIKSVLGGVALITGIGFLSKFLNETPIGKAIKESLGPMKDKFIEVLKPFMKILLEFFWEGVKVVLFTLPIEFMKATFNFFGLKDLLGEENEGLAVLITKGIYYGVKNMVMGKIASIGKVLNFLSFGTFGKLAGKISGVIKNSIFEPLRKWIFGPIISLGDKLLKVGEFITKSIGPATGIISKITKIGGGSIFKMLGTAFKQVAKRIPFIGAALSFYDAYQRISKGDVLGGLIGIGSGIASLFGPIGIGVSIGLDVLNAVLDSDDPSSFKNKINSFMSNTVNAIVDGTISFFTKLLDLINPVSWGKDIWNWFTGEKDRVSDKMKNVQPVDTFRSDMTSPETKSTQRWDMPQKVNDARTSGSKIIIPNSADDVIMAKTGGPFDMAFKEMNNKMDILINVFTQGIGVIAQTNNNGSSSIVQAVFATAGAGKQSGNKQASDPINDYRKRAQNAIG
jgi:hypothetical protein